MGKIVTSWADLRAGHDLDAGVDRRAVADGHAVADRGEGVDVDVAADSGSGANGGQGADADRGLCGCGQKWVTMAANAAEDVIDLNRRNPLGAKPLGATTAAPALLQPMGLSA